MFLQLSGLNYAIFVYMDTKETIKEKMKKKSKKPRCLSLPYGTYGEVGIAA